MQKKCILYDNKICVECGECDMCDINPKKRCNNCGKCLDGYDYTAIQIDDLLLDDSFDKGSDNNDYIDDRWKFANDPNTDVEPDPSIVFIDDVEGLADEIEHQHSHEHNHNDHCHHDN